MKDDWKRVFAFEMEASHEHSYGKERWQPH